MNKDRIWIIALLIIGLVMTGIGLLSLIHRYQYIVDETTNYIWTIEPGHSYGDNITREESIADWNVNSKGIDGIFPLFEETLYKELSSDNFNRGQVGIALTTFWSFTFVILGLVLIGLSIYFISKLELDEHGNLRKETIITKTNNLDQSKMS